MSSEKDETASTLALAPVVRMFTYAVIKTMKNKNFSERKLMLHADMVPKMSERVINASMGERISNPHQEYYQPMIQSIPISPETLTAPLSPELSFQDVSQGQFPKSQIQIQNISLEENIPKQQISSIMEPQNIQPPKPMLLQEKKPIASSNQIPSPRMRNPQIGQMIILPTQQMTPPISPVGEELTQFYGKITPLLSDPSISVIECSGMGVPIMVVRRGQKQPTKIILGDKDIRQVLDKVSEAAHIPLLEGVFRAAVDTFSISAVISEIIGSRFVIRKQSLGQMTPSQGNESFHHR